MTKLTSTLERENRLMTLEKQNSAPYYKKDGRKERSDYKPLSILSNVFQVDKIGF